MKSFGELIGTERIVTLAEADGVVAQTTQKVTPEETRVAASELELAYLTDSITKSAIFKASQAIMAAGWKLQCNDPNVKAFFEEYLANIGKVGEKITFNEILESIFKYQMIYGNAYIETVLGKNTNSLNNIVDLVIIDPKRIDYAKDASQKILLDKYGMPVGYTQQLPLGVTSEGLGDLVPEGLGVDLGADRIFLKPERICHFKFDTVGDRFYGIGLIESSYSSILRKQNIEVAQSNSIFQRGTSPIIDYVGDEFHDATPQLIIDATKKLAKLQYNRYMAFPRWHKLETIEMRDTGAVDKTLKYLREAQTSSLLTPLAIATGIGEATNRATLTTQLKFMEFALNGMVDKTLATIVKFIFARICEFNNFNEVPNIIWGNISVEEINDKAARIIKYVDAGILTADEAKQYAIDSEGLK